VNGVGIGDGWTVIASRSGLYYFDGSAPSKMSQEIQPNWDTINWQYGETLWVVVDVESKRIYIGAPTGSATEPNTLFVMDYTNGWQGRQWTIWTQTGNSGLIAEQSTGGKKFCIGTNDGSGLILQYDTTTHADDGDAIDAYYETAPIGEEHGLTLFLGSEIQASGVGTMTISTRGPDGVVQPLRQYGTQDPWRAQIEFPMHIAKERVGFRFASNSSSGYFNLQRLNVWLKRHPLGARGRTP